MSDPDRMLKLEEWLQDRFDRLCEVPGHTPVEVADALLRLACARVLALKAQADVEDEIRKAVAAVHGCEEASPDG